jgi:hypothetical protein
MTLALAPRRLLFTAAVPWFRRPEHWLDGVAPGFIADIITGRHALSGRAATFADLFSVTAAAGKTYVDSGGVLRTTAANTPRLDYTSGVAELLLEGVATNLCTYSDDPTNGNWTVDSMTVGAAPNGWWQVRETTGAATFHRIYRNGNAGALTAGTTYCVSARVAKAGRRYVGFRGIFVASSGSVVFDLDTAAVAYRSSTTTAAGITRLPDGSFLIFATWAAASSAQLSVGVMSYASVPTDDAVQSFVGDSAQGFNFRFLQVEAGGVPTSYIPTAGTAVTRTADLCQLTPAAAAVLQGAGAVAWRGNAPTLIASQQLLGLSGWALLRAAQSSPVTLLADGYSSGALAIADVFPGQVNVCFGWGTSGRRAAQAGNPVVQDALLLDKSRAQVFLGSSSGLVSGQIIRLRQLVGWPLADRPSAAGVQTQARIAA